MKQPKQSKYPNKIIMYASLCIYLYELYFQVLRTFFKYNSSQIDNYNYK